MADKLRIEPGSVQETLIIPLCGRKLCASIDYDFADMLRQAQSMFCQFGALEAAMRQIGMQNYDDCLHVDDIAEVEGWAPTAHVSARGYMLGYNDMDDPAVASLLRFLARRCGGMAKMRIVRMDFAE